MASRSMRGTGVQVAIDRVRIEPARAVEEERGAHAARATSRQLATGAASQ